MYAPIIKKYTPQLISFGFNGDSKPFYTLEYLPYLPLNEIFVHGRNSIIFWNKQFDLFLKYFEDSRKSVVGATVCDIYNKILLDSKSLYETKTLFRLNEFSNLEYTDFQNFETFIKNKKIIIKNIVDECINKTLDLPLVPAILHGDFCFSNILYDSRSQKIKVIDPRGINYNKEMTIYGDQKYDFAKLTHSLIGLYDFIMAC